MKDSLKSILLWIFSIFDKLVSLIFAVLFAQFPMLLSFYLARLGGHIDELSRVVGQYRAMAIENGRNLTSFIEFYMKSSEPEFVSSGKVMLANIERVKDLKVGYEAISSSSGFYKPLAFIKNLDFPILEKTFSSYQLGISFTFESLVYALFGVVFATLFIMLIRRPLFKRWT